MINQIKVGGVIYSIDIVPLVVVDGNRNCQGSVDHNITAINILDAISEERRKEVLIHEMTHAIAHEANIDVSEESVVQFARVLYQVLQDNDFEWLKRSAGPEMQYWAGNEHID